MLLLKNKTLRIVKNIAITIFGTLILSLGTAVFILPYDLVIGGVSGIGIILAHLIADVPTEVWIAALTWILFIIGYFALGKDFAMKTLISSLVYPLGIAAFSPMATAEFFGGFLNLGTGQYSEISVLLASVFGGCLIGIGCAIVFLGGGSTGGVDILSFILCKCFPRLKSSRVIFLVDALIIALSMLIVGDFALSLLGIIAAFVGSLVIDRLFLGQSRAFVALVFSDAYVSINEEIIRRLNRTTTMLEVIGGYTKRRRIMLLITFPMREYNELLSIISRLDKDAFVAVYSAHEITGFGWTENKENRTQLNEKIK